MTVRAARSTPASQWLGPGLLPEMLSCVSLLALAFAVRVPYLSRESLWADELFTVYWSQLDAGYLLGQGAHVETNPPTYYLLMHAWMRLFGNSELGVRLPSVLLSVATVVIVYTLARMLFDRGTALLAGLLAVLEPATVHFAREARQYALLALMDGLVLLALAGYARDAAARGLRPWLWAALFVFAAIGAISVHYTSVIFVGACFIAIGTQLITTSPFPVRESLKWSGLAAVIGVCSIEFLILASGLASAPSISWIPPLSGGWLRHFFLTLLSPSLAAGRFKMQLVGLSLVGIFGSSLPWLRLNRVQLGLLVLVPVTFCLLVVGVSLARPILLSRIGIWLTIPICILLARAATTQPTTLRRVGVAAAVSVIFLGLLAQYYSTYENEDWRGAARVVMFNAACSGPIVSLGTPFGLTYYQPSLVSRSFWWLALADANWRSSSYVLASKVLHPDVLSIHELKDFLQHHPHSGLVLRAFEREILDPLDPPTFATNLPGGMSVSCF